MKLPFLPRIPLPAVWVLVAVCFVVPIVQAQDAAHSATRAAASAKRAATSARETSAQQQKTIDRLSALVAVECSRSTNGAALRNAMIDTMTQHLSPGIIPPGPTALRNKQYDAQRKKLLGLGDLVPKVAC